MSISLTLSAATKLGELLQEENNPQTKLRIFVSGGGCSGFKYGFTFDDTQEEGDTLIESHGAKVLVDSTSLGLLAGAEVDYIEDLSGAQFVIRNPNASSSCGCGQSFTPNSMGGCSNS
ncbi:MAG: iron-sulfur cluster insertion protein ErpA [Magnetococcales bacterium]|nr:iron-sulfur cluster insertion protein ErpA [Magnetococcales bacterium]MBF0263290.1 iron-sulfur cluster insertion protein ErpA [Magnetococcales bacterium]